MLKIQDVFKQIPQNPDFMDKFKNAIDIEELTSLCKKIEPNIKQEEVETGMREIINQKGTRLSDEELEMVAGGKMNFNIMKTLAVAALIPVAVATTGVPSASALEFSVAADSINISHEAEQNLNYQTLEEIIKAKPDLNKIDENYPLNEIDNLIFSTIAYLPFLNIIPKLGENKNHVTIEEYAATLQKIMESENNDLLNKYVVEADKHSLEEYKLKQSPNYNKKYDPMYNTYINRLNFLKVLAKCERYKNIKMGDYSTQFKKYANAEEYHQFAAISFTLENGEKAVSFRGTDSTPAGWKENVDMIWKNKTQAQKYAGKYLKDMMNRYSDSKFTISGHSKGGNLAVYSFLKNLDAPGCLSRVNKIYSFDGPGIRDDILEQTKEKDRYKEIYENHGEEIKKKIMVFVPQETVVSTFMNNSDYFSYFVISSDASAIRQHDPSSWLVHSDFIKTDALRFKFTEKTILAIAFEEAWPEIMKKLDKKTVESVSQILFDFYNNNNIEIKKGVGINLKKIFFNYLAGKSTTEILKLMVSPSKIITLSDKEYNDFKNISEIVVRELLTAFWKHHAEINKTINLSENTLKSIEKLKDSDFSKWRILKTALLFTKDYVKKVGVIGFLKKLI